MLIYTNFVVELIIKYLMLNIVWAGVIDCKLTLGTTAI